MWQGETFPGAEGDTGDRRREQHQAQALRSLCLPKQTGLEELEPSAFTSMARPTQNVPAPVPRGSAEEVRATFSPRGRQHPLRVQRQTQPSGPAGDCLCCLPAAQVPALLLPVGTV